MKSRRLPIWLLLDVPAFLGVKISFWPLMILVIRNGFAAMRGKKISISVFDLLPILLAHAEARLDFALWREAYRRLGWNPRLVTFQLFPAPETWAETAPRFESYRRANMDIEACVRLYTNDLRQRYRIAKHNAAAHGSTDARLRRAAHHEQVGAAPFALTLTSAQSARPSKGERSHAHARGPPLRSSLLKIQTRPTSQVLPARPRPRARLRNPRGSPRGNCVRSSARSPSAVTYAGEPPRR